MMQTIGNLPTDNAILAFECIGQGFSLCYGRQDGHEYCFEQRSGFSAKHQLIQALQIAQQAHGKPSALAVAVGPGSFTGLRVATVAARSIAWALQIPIFAIDTLAAMALAQGPGQWLCLLPLKRDTTFAAAYSVSANGIDCIFPCTALLDSIIPQLTISADFTAIGPALESKPDLITQWQLPCLRGDSMQAPDARAILAATHYSTPQAWQEILPAYFQASAPELQRQQRQQQSQQSQQQIQSPQ